MRLTQLPHEGGCVCNVPPGGSRASCASPARVAGYRRPAGWAEHGDNAAVVRVDGDKAVLATADFHTCREPRFDWGRIAAANALSDVYAHVAASRWSR